MKLCSVGAVVGRIGDEVSDGARTARLTSTYTGKANTIADRDHGHLEDEGAPAVAVHDAALSLRDSTVYWPAETTATIAVSTTARAML